TIVVLAPGLHADGTVIEDVYGGEAGLQLAENNTLLDESVVAAVVLSGQIAVAECAVLAFEAASERGNDPRSQRWTHHTRAHQGRGNADAVRPGEPLVMHCRQLTARPIDPRMIGTERETQVEVGQIEGHEVIEGIRLDGIQRRDPGAKAAEDGRGDRLGANHADIDTGCVVHGIPVAEGES